MKVCYLGAYNQQYARNCVIRKGLEQQGIQVIECHIPETTKFWKRYPLLIREYFHIPRDFDVIFVAEINQFVVPLAKLFSIISGKPLVFDIFFSLYDASVKDRKITPEGTLSARMFHALDAIALRLADWVIADTQQHADYYHQVFHVAQNRMSVIYVGCDDALFFPRPKLPDSQTEHVFKISFIGTFIPLHGVEYILGAAKQLEHIQEIQFEFIGNGQTYQEMRKLSERLHVNNCVFCGATALENLPTYIAKSDLCLGIFGNTEKTMRVIPNKVYHTLAMKKPLLTGDTPAIREVFRDGEHLVLCPVADDVALAEAILRLKDNAALRVAIAENGYRLVSKKFVPRMLGETLKDILQSLLI